MIRSVNDLNIGKTEESIVDILVVKVKSIYLICPWVDAAAKQGQGHRHVEPISCLFERSQAAEDDTIRHAVLALL